EQALDALGAALADGLGHLPAVLALHPGEQAGEVAPHPRPDLRAPEPMRDALVQPLPRRRALAEDERLSRIALPPALDHDLPPRFWGSISRPPKCRCREGI